VSNIYYFDEYTNRRVLYMQEKTKNVLVKVGKTIVVGLIGAAIGAAAVIGFTIAKKGGGGSGDGGSGE
jgi:hypothetical protein